MTDQEATKPEWPEWIQTWYETGCGDLGIAIEGTGQKLLEIACHALHRADQAGETIKRQGAIPGPAVDTEREYLRLALDALDALNRQQARRYAQRRHAQPWWRRWR